MNLRLQSIPQSFPIELAKLADDIPPSSQRIPSIDQILEKINNGQANTLSAVECFWCVRKKEEWDNQRPSLEVAKLQSSQQLWLAAAQNSLLKYYLLRGYLRSHLENYPFAESLKQTIYNLKNALPKNDGTVVLIESLAQIPTQGSYSIVSNSAKIQWGKQEILEFVYEYTGLVTVDLSDFTLQAAELFARESQSSRLQTNDYNNRLGRWLIKCLNQETDFIDKHIKAVEKILITVRKEDGSQYPEFVDWLKQNYQKSDRAKHLSDDARSKLREWIGAVNFADFEKLVDIILYGEFVDGKLVINTNKFLYKGSNERKLKSRKDFWSNYSDRFEQIRILIPESSRKKISNALFNEVTIIQSITEICIFDFGKLFVAEFFRGKGKESEMRLFRYDENTRRILFDSPLLSMQDIRDLGGEEKLHTGEWQKECERTLTQYGIYPNDGLTEFTFSGEDKRSYRRDVGILSKKVISKTNDH